MNIKIAENPSLKIISSPTYNLVFDKKTGFTARWGSTKEENPQYAPMPEILDLEISEGMCGGLCSYCYKQNQHIYYKITLNNGQIIMLSEQEFLHRNLKVGDIL